MDRRIKKTKTAIFEAYITAKKMHRGVEPSVKEICAIADINKTTFYRYFTDIETLSNAIINVAIDRILIQDMEVEKLFFEPEVYFRRVIYNYKKYEEDMKAFLADNPHTFIFEAERILKNKLKEAVPEKYDDVLCTFIAGGAAHYFLSENYNDENELRKFCRIIKAATASLT